jgi:hypothetical protein
MEITRSGTATQHGPPDWFTGTVFLDAVAAPEDGARITASSVHFTPGARTAWHTHPNGQTIFVLEGLRVRGQVLRRAWTAAAVDERASSTARIRISSASGSCS